MRRSRPSPRSHPPPSCRFLAPQAALNASRDEASESPLLYGLNRSWAADTSGGPSFPRAACPLGQPSRIPSKGRPALPGAREARPAVRARREPPGKVPLPFCKKSGEPPGLNPWESATILSGSARGFPGDGGLRTGRGRRGAVGAARAQARSAGGSPRSGKFWPLRPSDPRFLTHFGDSNPRPCF